MENIAVTKPDMGVLSRGRLSLSPFGALSQALAQEILARAGQEEGVYPYVPMDLLEEGEEPQSPPPPAPRTAEIQVELKLVLEALRRAGKEEKERAEAVQRVLERTVRLQERFAVPLQNLSRPYARPLPGAAPQGASHAEPRREALSPVPSFAEAQAAAKPARPAVEPRREAPSPVPPSAEAQAAAKPARLTVEPRREASSPVLPSVKAQAAA